MFTEEQLLDRADNPQSTGFLNVYWGKVSVIITPVVLEKGVGRVAFDEKLHKPEQMRTAIDIALDPIAAMNLQFSVERNLIAESKEWAKTTLPSIKALGAKTSALNGAYVRVRLAETGESYINKNGEQKSKTAFVFEAVFASEAACEADFNAQGNAPAPTQAAPGTNGNSKEQETALKFLAVMVTNAARGETDLAKIQAKLAGQIAGMPMVNKYFTVDSPETLGLIATAMVAA